MGLFDPPTQQQVPQPDGTNETQEIPGDTSDLAYGLDTHAALSNEKSLFDTASDVVTKGVPLTGLQIVNSFVNTGIKLANVFGANTDEWSVAQEAPGLEDATGQTGLNEYYEQHKQGIDTASLLLGSVIPGTIGIKALKWGTSALRASTALSTEGEASGILARATGLLPSVQKEQIINDARTAINNSDGLFNTLTAEKTKAIALGFGDQFLQSLAYETFTYGTMKANPILDQQNFSEVTQNIFYGALTGAGIGGVLEGIGTRTIFNKMIQGADDVSKAQQIYTNLGMGDFEAGDRVNSIISSIYNMPKSTTGLGRVYSKTTTDAALLTAKKALGDIVPKGDEELSNGFIDIIHKMATDGTISQEQAYQMFGRIAKIDRVTNPVNPDVDTGTFYINKRASKTGPSGTNWQDTVSQQPGKLSDLNLRYQLAPGKFDPVVAKHNDIFWDVSGNPQMLYKNSDDAFKQGADLWINSKGDIIVNPQAPNIQPIPKTGESRILTQKEEAVYRPTGKLLPDSKPLFGTQVNIGDKPGATILNLKTGNVTDSAIPTIGDHGGLQYTPKGMRYGDGEFSDQSINDPISPDTSTIDASARYAWFQKRGIKSGDNISSEDIPAMETLIRQMGEGALDAKAIGKIKVDGDEVPQVSDLIDLLKETKVDTIQEDIRQGMGAEEAALRSNAPESFIKNGFQAPNGINDFVNAPDYHSTATHASLWYNIGNLNQQDGMILKGLRDTQYRVQLIQQAARDASAGFFGANADQYIINSKSSDAGLTKYPGPGFWKFSSANYDTAAQEYERVGRTISGKNSKDMDIINGTLYPSAQALRQDPDAAAEVGMFRSVRQRTGEAFTWLPEDLEQKYLNTQNGNTAVLQDALVKDDKGNVTDWNPNYLPKGFTNAVGTETSQLQSGLRNYYSLGDKSAAWERANQVLNDQRVIHRNNFNAATGSTRKLPTGTLYTPPINTAKYSYIAYVKARPGTGMADDSVGVITAASQVELQGKIAQLADDYSIYTKTGEASTKAYHEVEGDYQYDRNFAQNRISNDLRRRGILNDVTPDTRAQNIIQDYLDWHGRQVVGLNRDYTELSNGQLFAELRSMGDRFTATGQSRVGFVSPALERQSANPYQSYINTALNISPKEQYRTWAFTNEKLESLFQTGFDALRSGFQSARAGIISYDKASDLAEKFGIGKIYENAYYTANKIMGDKPLSKFIGAANTILGTGIIRLDAYQSLIHAITTPMLTAVETASVRGQIAKGLLNTVLPGTEMKIPATVKLLYNAVKNYWDKDVNSTYGELYNSVGADKTVLGAHKQMMDQLALPFGSISDSDIARRLSKAADIGATLTGSNFTNSFNHFISADVGRQIFEAAGFTGKGLQDQVMTFVNRVQGNYIAGQRPVAFQGPVGQAFGLFQTFGLNMLQNLFRYVQNGEAKTLGILGGLQTSLFGLQGMPGFNFINTHLVGNAIGNPTHADLYSSVASGLGAGRGSLGDYLLYGVTSNWLDANLYSRGDISPRNLTIFPTNPLDVPIVRAGINVTNNILQTVSKLTNGAPVGSSLLLALEHNGLSRPLSGLAQLAQGYATDTHGNLIGTTQGIMGNSDLFSWANFSRLMGARPLEEAVMLSDAARMGIYQAKTEARINSLGDAAKVSLYGNKQTAASDIMDLASDYAAVGGSINKFNSTVTKWTNQANASIGNKVWDSLRTNPDAKNAMMEMGGLPMPDYRMRGSIQASGGSQ